MYFHVFAFGRKSENTDFHESPKTEQVESCDVCMVEQMRTKIWSINRAGILEKNLRNLFLSQNNQNPRLAEGPKN